jgi:hypothetical protein
VRSCHHFQRRTGRNGVLRAFRSLVGVLEVVSVAVRVERDRARKSPSSLLSDLRRRGAHRARRDAAARSRLRRAITLVDSVFPSGPNCYRRALVEIAIDAGAAAEPLYLGLSETGIPQSGHAWLGDTADSRRYDAEFVV